MILPRIFLLYLSAWLIGFSAWGNAPHSFVFNGTNYEIHKQGLTWVQAVNTAVSNGGKLAEINSIQEQNAIFAELANASINPSDTVAPDGGGGAYLWIGGNDLVNEGTWVWNGDNDSNFSQFWTGNYLGSSIVGFFNNWGTLQAVQNEPDDYLAQQDALAISLNGWPLGTAGQWNDINQDNLLFFVVEYNGVPVFSSGPSFSVLENQTTVGEMIASDPNGESLSFSIIGGIDQSKFSINPASGMLEFIIPNDYENPTDSNLDNIYEVIVGVSDGIDEANQSISITVLDVNESVPNSPPFELNSTATLTVRENQPIGTIIGSFTATDQDENSSLTFELVEVHESSHEHNHDHNDGNNPPPSDPGADPIILTASDLENGKLTITAVTTIDSLFSVEIVFSNLVNMQPSQAGPLIFNIEGIGSFDLVSLNQVNPYEGWGYNWSYWYNFGFSGTNQDLNHSYLIPYAPEESYYLTQGYFGSYSHQNSYALDWMMPEGTILRAARGGKVIDLKEDSNMGGPDASFAEHGNYVTIGHRDGSQANYVHLEQNGALVEVGDEVMAGEPIGLSGNTGWSTGPHLHFQVFHQTDPRTSYTAPTNFIDRDGNPITLGEGNQYFGSADFDPSSHEDIHGLNSLFTLDPDGTLYTATIFDYEENASSFPLTVRVTDEHNASMESNFTVFLINEDENISEDLNESGIGVGPEFTLDTRDPELPPIDDGGTEDLNESGIGVGPEFTLDTRYPELPPIDDGGSEDLNESGIGVGPEFTLDTRDPELPPIDDGGPEDLNESGIGVGPEFTLDTRDPELPPIDDGGSEDMNESGIGVGPEFTLDTRDPELPPIDDGGPEDMNESGIGVGPEFTLDTRDPELPPMDDGGPEDVNESGIGVGPEFTLDTRDPELPPMDVGDPEDMNESGIGVGPEFTLDTRDPEFPPMDDGGPEDVNKSGIGVGPEFTLDTRDPELPLTVPFDFNATALMISEDAPIDSLVGNFYQTSGDRNVSVTYQIEGASSPLPFAIVGGGDLISTTLLDYESISQFSITVKAETSKGEVVIHDFVIEVIDVYEAPFDFNATALMISEDAPIDSLVGNFYQTSGDRNVNVTYQIEGASTLLPFALVGGGDLISRGLLDYELINQYSITVKAETSKGEVVIHDFVIEVIDVYEAPFDFNATALKIPEDALIGSLVGSFFQSSGELTGSVVYKLEYPVTGSPLPFIVDANGSLLTSGLLDYEGNENYSISITAISFEGETVTHDFMVEVIDVYEAPFDFNATVLKIPEDAPIGSLVGSFFQSSGELSGPVAYKLENLQAENPHPFIVDVNGSLLTNGLLDYEKKSSYIISVQALTGKAEKIIHEFRVEVLDVYEYVPGPFDFNSSILKITEDALPGSMVGFMTQTSGDENTTVQYSLIHDPVRNPVPFKLELDGKLITTARLDYEEKSEYLIEVTALTYTNESITHEFIIEVLDVYEAPFDFNASELKIAEDALPGSVVGFMTQSSGDENTTVQYTLIHDPTRPSIPFKLEPSGKLVTSGPLDYEEKSEYLIEVSALTNKNENVIHVFTIEVQDIYEAPFDFNASGLKIAEDARPGSVVGMMIQTSGDENAEVQYTLIHDPARPSIPFKLEPGGKLVTSGRLDYEEKSEYMIEVSALTNENENVIHVFTIEVQDIYEAPFDFNASELKVAEDALPGSTVGQMFQSSGDENVTVHYSLNHDPSAPPVPFMLEADGKLVTTGSLDYEEKSEYLIEVSAWTDQNENAIHVFTVEILDVYEAPFDFNASELKVAEDVLPGSLVGQMFQSSGDENVSIHYSLQHDPSAPPVPFILEANGQLFTTGPLNYEEKSEYFIEVHAWTDVNENAFHVFKIEILDVYEAPFDFNASELKVAEDALPGSLVGQMFQSSGDENVTIHYQLNHHSTGPPVPFLLEADGQLFTTGPLNYEEMSEYLIEVSAWTDGNENATHVFTVTVMDIYEAPFDFNASELKVAEDALPGSLVGQMLQASGDENVTVHYLLVQDLSGPPVPFMLEADGKLVTTGPLDYEEKSEFMIEVSAWTDRNENATHVFTIEVLDIYEAPFDFNASELKVAEDAQPGSVVGQMFQSSGDENVTIHYQLNHVMTGPPVPFMFQADGKLVTTGPLDYEEKSEYLIEVGAWTDRNENAVHVFTVLVLDQYEDPFDFNATGLKISEDAPVGSVAGQMYQISGDENQTIEYRILSAAGSQNVPFRIENNGTVISTELLNFELISHYPISVEGMTAAGESKIHDFTILISPTYQNIVGPLDFNSTALLVEENRPAGSVVGQMYQTSGDENAVIDYQLIHDPISGSSPFILDGNGTLLTVATLDYEKNSTFGITVEASTSGGEKKEHFFVVNVADVHEEAFDFNATVLSVAEDAPVGTMIGTFFQTKGDQNATATYHIMGDSNLVPPPFRLDLNGSLFLTGALDYEKNGSYPLEVSGWTDGHENAIHSFEVIVTDVLEEPFDFNASDLTVAEDASSGTMIGSFFQTKGEPADRVSYALTLGTTGSMPPPFRLDANGVLFLTGTLDYEKNASYSIEVSAWTDGHENAVRSFVVNVTDVFEEPFDFNASDLTVAEDASSGTMIGTFFQTKGDPNTTATYHIMGDSNLVPSLFRLDVNGSLFLSGVLDYEKNASYSIEVSAWTDGYENAVRSFVVNVTDVFEEAFDFNATSLSVAEDASSGTMIGSFFQNKGDPNATATYHLMGDSNVVPFPFRLDINGSLFLTGALDYEKNASYPIDVSAWTDDHENAVRSFVVTVTDIYEEPFDFNATDLIVSEDAPVGTMIGSFYQSMGEPAARVSYSLIMGATGSMPPPFRLDANGSLFLNAALDYEKNASYSIEVSAWTDIHENAVRSFVVNVTDIYEEPFDFNATDLIVAEDAPMGMMVGTFFQSTGEPTTRVSYSLTGGTTDSRPPPFRLDSNGSLFLNGALDYEKNASYSIEVSAWTDNHENTVRSFLVTVTDVYEAPFDFNATALLVSEDASIGTPVGSVFQSGGKPAGSVVYTLEYPVTQTPPPFRMELDGSMITTELLDYETHTSYSITISAVTDLGEKVSHDYVVEVTDIYEEPFDFNATVLLVSEEAPIGTQVGSVFQTGGKPAGSVVYTLEYPVGQTPPPFRIELDGSMITTELLDYETHTSYSITISAFTDMGEKVSHDYVVEVTDIYEEPFDFNTTVLSVSEEAPIGSLFGSVFQSGGKPVGSVMYTLEHPVTQTPPPFRIDLDGSMLTTGLLDYETRTSYPITISAITDLGEKVSHDYMVEVTDVYEAPFDFNATALIVSEDSPIGTIVGSVSQSSGKIESSVVYTMLQTAGQMPLPFILESKGNLVSTELLDYENVSSYSISIRATTQSGDRVTHDFVVEITDVYEAPFDFNATMLSVLENEPIGTLVGSVFQSSGKLDGPVLYRFDYPVTQNPPPFMIESNGSVVTNELLDFESQPNYAVTISATTNSGEMATQDFVIEVIDVYEAPFDFNATVFRVFEDATIGTVVGSVFQTSGKSDVSVVYGLEYPQTQNPPPFILEGNGTLVSTGMLDFETMPNYVISIRGITSRGETAIYEFTIEVLDVNELPPNNPPSEIEIKPAPLSIKGNKDIGTEVGTLMAVDLDALDSHTFAIINGSGDRDNSYFELSQNGVLTTREVLNLGSDQTLIIRAEVTDSRGDSFSKAITIDYIHEEPGEDAVLLTDGVEVIPGWKRAGWFGFYFADFYPWVFHENLGWLFVSEKSMEGAWFHRERLGWVWTSPEVFPNLYMIEKNEWVYLDNNYPFTVLFDFQRMEWFHLDVDLYVTGSSNPNKGGYIKGLGNYERGELATLEAVHESGYLFVEWRGSLSGTDPVQQVEMYEDFEVEAIFEPIISPNASPAEKISNALKAIQSMDHLSTEEKQQSLVELLLFGKSSTAGISGSN